MRSRPDTDGRLVRRLLSGLADIGGGATRGMNAVGAPTAGESLFSYCSFERERLAAVRLPKPVLGIILCGRKEVWRSDLVERFGAGTMFVLPGGVDFDVLNIPDERRGLYRTLILEVEPKPVAAGSGPAGPEAPGSVSPGSVSQRSGGSGRPSFGAIPLTPALVDTALHAARAIAAGSGAAQIRAARCAELLALLRDEPAAAPLYRQSFGDRVAQVIAAAPAHGWTAPELAERFGMSVATLRRRLVQDGASLRRLLRRERMQAARKLIDEEGESSQTAALSVGYASRSHFARQFRSEIGRNPRRGGDV